MANETPQNLANHGRLDPLFHLFILPVFAISWIAAIVWLVRRPGVHPAWMVIFLSAAIVAVFKIRLYSLKVQDRVIRLEERLRLNTLLDPALRPRIGEFTLSQLVALRFASDVELPGLAAKTLNEKLPAAEIKKAIQQWRPDYLRV